MDLARFAGIGASAIGVFSFSEPGHSWSVKPKTREAAPM
jgi:hypothetical protein